VGTPKDPAPDVLVDNAVGYVFAPAQVVADKVVVAMLILFSEQYNLVHLWTSDPSWGSTAGVPAEFKKFLKAFTAPSLPQLPFYPP
jgi:hypothetical protein